ncbi:MAG TPA: hypothetical protein VF710_15520 [Longimicrobium sp.]|jgi:hypothetical protein
MKAIHSALVAAALLTTTSLWAQQRPSATGPVIRTALDSVRLRSVPVRFTAEGAARTTVYDVPLDPGPGTQLAQQGAACAGVGPGGGCVVAQGSAESAPGVSIRMTDGTMRGNPAARTTGVAPGGPVTITATYRVGATMLVPHDRPHRLSVSLDGSEVMGFSCNGRAMRLQAPGGGGFRWEVYHGTTRVDGGTSTGAPVDVANPPHLAGPGGGPLQLTVQQGDPARLAGADDAWCKKYGCVQLAVAHGQHRIVVMPVLTRDRPYALRSVGLTVAGVPAFALTDVEVARDPVGPVKWMSPEARTP